MTTLELIKSDFKARGVNPTLPRIIICTLFSYSYKPLIYIRLCMGGGGGGFFFGNKYPRYSR